MRHNRVTATVGGVLLAAGVGAGLAACSSGPSSPPNATQILQSDGYTPSAAYTGALQSGIGNSDGTVTSSQAGTEGDNIQGVVVFDNSTDAAAGVSALNGSGSTGFYTGLTVAQNGDVVTVTGPVSAWASAGSSN